MMGETGKLSLVSQFDDLCRYEAIFHEGLETDFLKFVRNQEVCRLHWLQTEKDLKTLQEEYEITVLERDHWKSNSEDHRMKFQAEQKKRLEVEQRLRELTNLFGEVKEVVNRDNTITDQTKERFAMWQKYEPMQPINENVESEQSMEYDQSGDLLGFAESNREHTAGSKRHSRGNSGRRSGHTPPKRKKSSVQNEEAFLTSKIGASIVATTTVNVPSQGGDIFASTKLNAFRQVSTPVLPSAPPMPPPTPPPMPGALQEKLKRRNEREDIILIEPSAEIMHFRPPISSGQDCNTENLYPTQMLKSLVVPGESNMIRTASKTSITPRTLSNNTLPFRQHNSGSKLSGKVHDWATKTVIRPETCLPCGRRIKFSKQALKCHNCRATCHPECKGGVPLPCIPVAHHHTPNKNEVTWALLAPQEPPRIPAPIVHCVNEVESRPKEVGLYRLSGADKEVKELKDKFLKGKGVPNLTVVDVHVLCALVKDFLRSLDPLVPKLMWKDFTDAAEKDLGDGLSALYQCIGQLPLPNRDTMAFLMLHWQRLADAPEVKMPVKNLATVLGPTVVGFSANALDGKTMMKEQVLQVKVMERLLRIPADYWNSFLQEQNDVPLFSSIIKPSDLITPESRSSKIMKHTSSSNFLTPRLGSLPRRPVTRGQQRFFASPSLLQK